MHKLMIKTHNKTGLKYLCYTQKEDHIKYTGSGKYWRHHIKQHGYDVETKIIFESKLYDEFLEKARHYSVVYNVVESTDWANLRIEEGNGGDTVSNKMWITDGLLDKYILKDAEIPVGWSTGRSNCIFKNSDKQKEFSAKADISSRGNSIKQAWVDGKFANRKSHNGSPHSQETKDKLSKLAKQRPKVVCEHCTTIVSSAMYIRWHGEKCKKKL